MFMATISSLDDQCIAESLREICKRMGADEGCTILAIDVALSRYHDGASRATAINSGMAFALRAKAKRSRALLSLVETPARQEPELTSNFSRADIALMTAGLLLLAGAIAWSAF